MLLINERAKPCMALERFSSLSRATTTWPSSTAAVVRSGSSSSSLPLEANYETFLQRVTVGKLGMRVLQDEGAMGITITLGGGSDFPVGPEWMRSWARTPFIDPRQKNRPNRTGSGKIIKRDKWPPMSGK